jgi:hypothetical protein
MNVGQMKALLEFYIDDISDETIALQLFNAGKDRMSAEIEVDYPDVVGGGNLLDSFAFDPKFHELPVLYAAAMYKAADSSVNEKNSFMAQFEAGVTRFVQQATVEIDQKTGETTQQLVASSTSAQDGFLITKNDFSPRFTEMHVYVNGLETWDYRWSPDNFRLILIPSAVEGDKVTITWEMNDIWTAPPAFYPKGWR